MILYLAGGLLVIVMHADRLPETFALIFREAFSLRAGMGSVAGVAMWTAMRYGLARGIYANEAGYGTAAFVYGTARTSRPVQQGYAAVMEVFMISFVTSSISALTILVTGVWRSGLTSTAAVAEAFNHAVPVAGGWVVAFCAFLFGYTTLIGWAYYGEVCLEYILGPRVVRAVPLDLLRPHRARRHEQGGPRVGVGRPHERAADLPEPRRRPRPLGGRRRASCGATRRKRRGGGEERR